MFRCIQSTGMITNDTKRAKHKYATSRKDGPENITMEKVTYDPKTVNWPVQSTAITVAWKDKCSLVSKPREYFTKV